MLATRKTSKKYSFSILSLEEEVKVTCVGMDTNTSNQNQQADISPDDHLFTHVPAGALRQPIGEIQLLIGQDYGELLTVGGLGMNQVGGLHVMTDCPP